MATIYRHWFPCTVTPEIPHGKGYTGRTNKTVEERDKARFKPSADKDSVGLKRAIVKYTKENMQTDIIETDILPIKEVVDEREKYWIAYFDDYHNGYNWDKGGTGFDSETAREINLKRVKDGTNPFLGGEIQRKNNLKRVKDGTHPFLDGEIARKNNLKRVEDGTHPFLDGEIARKTQRKRVEDGTHPFLDGEMQRETQRKRVEDGTHPFLDSEFQSKNARKQVKDGTHPLLAKNRSPESEKKRIKALRKTLARKKREALLENGQQQELAFEKESTPTGLETQETT